VEPAGELTAHEVLTDGCSTATLWQPSLEDACQGQTVELRLWHFPISTTDEDWTLELGVGPDPASIASLTMPVPREAGGVRVSGTLPADVQQGDEVWIRISNHGINAWNVFDVTVVELDAGE
jgi:hypothetical protein